MLYPARETAEESIRDLARWHLSCHGQLLGGPTNLLAVLDGLGVRLRQVVSLQAAWNGSAYYGEPAGFALIIINTALPQVRQRFTIGHELGHIVQEHPAIHNRWLERAANWYASELLMPEPRLLAQIRTWGRDTQVLASLNLVSTVAMRWRLEELGTRLAIGS